MRHRRYVGLAAAAIAWAAAAIAWAAAPAETVNCGETLAQRTTLTADLDCSGLSAGGIALTVAGDHITLDLNGHTIKGPNDPTKFAVTGVLVTGVRDTVKGGTITGFSIDVGASGGAMLERLTLTNAATGAGIGQDVEVSRSTISGVDVGIESESGGETIARNAITANGRAGDPACADIVGGGACVGVVLFDGGDALIRNNTISSLGQGIALVARRDDTVRDNTVTCEGTGAARSTGACIDLSGGPSGGAVLARNSVTATIRNEISITGGSGVTLTRNTTSGSIDGSGIVLLNVNDSTVEDNTANDNGDAFDNGAYGLLVTGAGNLIKGNTANGNDLDGILSIGTNRLTANTARDNHGLGIQALGGAIDGGGNRASGNVEPQCIGVICTP